LPATASSGISPFDDNGRGEFDVSLGERDKADARTDGTQAIRRAAGILKFIAGDPGGGPTLREISTSMGLSRSTAHRILRCLVDEQLVAQSEDGKRYTIGDLTSELGLAAQNRKSTILEWHTTVQQVALDTGATTYLMGRSGNECVCLDKAEGPSVVRVIPVEVGQRRPLGVGAGSTAILASLPDDEREATMLAVAPHLSSYSRLTPEMVRAAVGRTRESGFAESRSHVAEGVYGLGIAIPGRWGAARLALSLAAHESHATDANIAAWKRVLQKAAQSRR
jgi:DNA-binding IclR family transcriptional regulator